MNLKWCCDIDTNRLKAISQGFKDVKVTKDVEHIINDREVHGVVIATSAVTHFRLAEKILRRGKHVYVEKPISYTIDEGRKIC